MATRQYDKSCFILAGWLVALGLFSVSHAAAQQNVPTVLVSRIELTALIEEVPLTGTVISPRIAELSTEVSGIVAEIGVELGDRGSRRRADTSPQLGARGDDAGRCARVDRTGPP